MSHTSLDRGGIELHPVYSEYELCQPRRWLRLRKSLTQTILFTNHFESPYRYKIVRNQNIFHFWYFLSTHEITCLRKIEKPEKPVSGTFLKTNISKNEKFIGYYINCESFNIIRSQKTDLRLRK